MSATGFCPHLFWRSFIFQACRIPETDVLMPRSHCSVFKQIDFCRYLSPIHTAPFLYKNGDKNARLCAFTLLTKTEEKYPFFGFNSFALMRFYEVRLKWCHWVRIFVLLLWQRFCFLSVFVRSHLSRAFSKASVFVNIHFEEPFRKPPFLCIFCPK